MGVLDFEEEGTAGYLGLLSSSVVVQIKSKMIYDAKRGGDLSEEEQLQGLWVLGSLTAEVLSGRRRYTLGHLTGSFIKHRTTRWDVSGQKEPVHCRGNSEWQTASHRPPDWGSSREPMEKKVR